MSRDRSPEKVRGAARGWDCRSAFTLIEIAAAVSVIGVVGALAVPTLQGVRSLQRDTLSANTQRHLGVLQHEYIADNDGRFSGINTSGREFNRIVFADSGTVRTADNLLGMTTPDTPTSTWDWISPIAGFEGQPLSANRAKRLSEILERYADPRATHYNNTLFGVDVADGDDFREVLAERGYRQVSYLQSAGFLAVGSDTPRIERLMEDGVSILQSSFVLFDFYPEVPADYVPTIDRVGVSPSMKVMHADGTRYLRTNLSLDLDISVNPNVYGSFAGVAPVLDFSTAYGRNPSGPVDSPANIELSFRQRDGSMLATMFDGSQRRISRTQAWTDPTPWYPSGTVWNPATGTPEANAFVANNLPGGVIP